MTGRIPARLASVVAALLAAASVAAITAASAGAEMKVYDNIPARLPGNLVSLGYEATSTSEFGGQVQFAGTTLRKKPVVFITMSSWACGNLKSGAECATAPGATFAWPITLNLYEVAPEDAIGAKLASTTQTFNIPYRPSANKKCKPTSEGVVGWGKHCLSGKAFEIRFSLPEVTLPSKAIISVAYNTTDHGYEPTHAADVGEDSLNVALRQPGEAGPSVGSDPAPADAYLNSSWGGAYCNEAEGVGYFRLDKGCWTGYQPAFEVLAATR